MHLMRAMGTTWSWLDVSIGQNSGVGFIQRRGLLKPVGYNPYTCPVPAVSVSVPGYRRVNGYTGTGLRRADQFFLEKTRCTHTRLHPRARTCTHVPAPSYPRTRTRVPVARFLNRYNGLLKRYNSSVNRYNVS
jgi:hypothetical protein